MKTQLCEICTQDTAKIPISLGNHDVCLFVMSIYNSVARSIDLHPKINTVGLKWFIQANSVASVNINLFKPTLSHYEISSVHVHE